MKNFRNIALWVGILLLLVALFNVFRGGTNPGNALQVPYSAFVTSVDRGEVQDATVSGEEISGRLKTGQAYVTYQPPGSEVVERMVASGVTVEVDPKDSGGIFSAIGLWLPMLVAARGVDLFSQPHAGGGAATR